MNEMYVAPELEVLEVMVEQGFAGSESLGTGSGGGSMEEPEGSPW